jgi:hypothetical protein
MTEKSSASDPGAPPITTHCVTVAWYAGKAFFGLFNRAIMQKKAVDMERNRRPWGRDRATLAMYASDATPGTIGYILFGFFTVFSLLGVSGILLMMATGLPRFIGYLGVPLAFTYAIATIHGGVWAYRYDYDVKNN